MADNKYTDDLINKKEYGFCNLLGNCLVYSKTLKDYNDMRKGLKSEARKELAERLKKKAFAMVDNNGSFKIVDVDDIDNLLKEMESEQ